MKDNRWLGNFSYTWLDSPFYELSDSYYRPSDVNFSALLSQQKSISIAQEGIWWTVYPCESEGNEERLPHQGWKIHVSAYPKNAEKILEVVASYLVPKGCPFKFALDLKVLEFLNSKAMHRGSSGKFMTIYPPSPELFREIINDLHVLLSGEVGPYILSDLRYKDSRVLYFRYGAFRHKHILDIMGKQVPAMATPSGEFVPDLREPYFSPPDWAEWPPELKKPQDSNTQEQFMLANRYEILEALSFSNSGGVYIGRDVETNKRVVIKEARPFTNFNEAGDYDALTLLNKEWEVLQQLKSAGVAPEPIELFNEWEHLYLVEEYISGVDIRTLLFRKTHPLLKVRPARKDSVAYLRSFFRLSRGLAKALQQVHDRGFLMGDFSATNIVIKRNSYRVVFIDFEASLAKTSQNVSDYVSDKPIILHTPGFRRVKRASELIYDEYDDLYSLAGILCYYIYPVTSLAYLRSDVFHTVYSQIIPDMGWPKAIHDFIVSIVNGSCNLSQVIEFLDGAESQMVEQVTAPLPEDHKRYYQGPAQARPTTKKNGGDVQGIAALNAETQTFIHKSIEGITSLLLETADSLRKTLFPVDPFAHATNPLSLGFGAGGILFALQKSEVIVPDEWKRWFLARVEQIEPHLFTPGLLTGLAGIGWILLELGEIEAAERIIDYANKHPTLNRDYTFFYGISGVGMTNLKFYLKTGNQKYLDFVAMHCRTLADTATYDGAKAYWKNSFSSEEPFSGLGFGQSGVALFLLRAYQLLGEESMLGLGESALSCDLSKGEYVESEVMSFRHEATLEPYVEVGSAGIAKVLLRYGWTEQARPVLNDLHRKYFVMPGYLFGASGVIDSLLDAYQLTSEPIYLRNLKRPLDGLRRMHLFTPRASIDYMPSENLPSGMAIPGEGLLRVSCDWGTGCAGTLRVLHRLATSGSADFMLDEVKR